MNAPVPYELNAPKPGALCLIGRDPGSDEVRLGRPFVGKAGAVLDAALGAAGIRRQDVNILNVSKIQPPGNNFAAHNRASLEREMQEATQTLARLKPSVIVALGNEACFLATGEEWPSKNGTIFGAEGIQERRGYVFDGPFAPVVAATHPAAVAREWVPWSPLLVRDLRKAKELHDAGGRVCRPKREVEIVSSPDHARDAVRALRRYRRLACDIETFDERRLACVGFAGEGGRAVVFPAPLLDFARELLEDGRIGKIWHNSLFDLYFLLTRCEIKVAGPVDDTMLGWHTLCAELAGAAEGVKPNARRRTAKSLGFLASLYTLDAWWKGEYDNETEFYIYNGKDCCITWDIDRVQQEQIDAMGVREVYQNACGLVWPLTIAHARGLRVDDQLRQERLQAIEGRLEETQRKLNELVVPLLRERGDRLNGQMRLFEQQEGVCPCCRHASKKQQRCWGCAGFESAPSKKELVAHAHLFSGETVFKDVDWGKYKKEELERDWLGVCEVCEGADRREWLEFNTRSPEQVKIVLYDLLKAPARYNHGKPTTDEEALKNILGTLT